MGDALGSMRHLEQLYKECASEGCRSALLAPFITESEYNGQTNTSVGWSDTIFRLFQPSFMFDASPIASTSIPLLEETGHYRDVGRSERFV